MSDTTNANARRDSAPQAGSLPFFARFLEGQSGEESADESGSAGAVSERSMTLKYPSDRDEWWDNRDK